MGSPGWLAPGWLPGQVTVTLRIESVHEGRQAREPGGLGVVADGHLRRRGGKSSQKAKPWLVVPMKMDEIHENR